MQKIAQTDGIRVNCICPGTVDTPPVRKQLAAQPPLFEKKTFDYIKTHMLRQVQYNFFKNILFSNLGPS